MKPYRIDFVNGRGHEMTLDRDGGIRRSELDELEINMLRSQRVPCLLPLEWMEVDGNVTFRYALGGKKMLLHKLQQQPLTMEQFYGLLLRAVSALMECRDYMLRPEGCMLGDMFLFVGERIEDLSFVYVPLSSRREESAQGDDLLAMAVRWTSYIEDVDGEGLRDVLSLFNGNRWPLAELRELLLEVLGSRAVQPAEKEEEDVGIPEYRSVNQRKRETDVYGQRAEPESPASESRPDVRIEAQDGEPRDSEQELHQEEPAADGKPGGGRRWMVVLAFVLGTACIWRFLYLGNASAQTMFVCLGLTVLLLVGAVLLWRKGAELIMRRSGPEDDADADELSRSFELQSGPMPAKERWRIQAEYRELGNEQESSATTSSLGNYSLPAQPRARADGRDVSRPNLLAPTTVLDGQAAGVADDGFSEGEKALLRRSWNGKEEEIPLQSEVFRIGRGSGGTGYEEKADGVSRMHLEIVKEQGCHAAKDLGSRNGSLLNGTMMIPYKSYPLAAGDTIQLAGSKGPSYQFKIN